MVQSVMMLLGVELWSDQLQWHLLRNYVWVGYDGIGVETGLIHYSGSETGTLIHFHGHLDSVV